MLPVRRERCPPDPCRTPASVPGKVQADDPLRGRGLMPNRSSRPRGPGWRCTLRLRDTVGLYAAARPSGSFRVIVRIGNPHWQTSISRSDASIKCAALFVDGGGFLEHFSRAPLHHFCSAPLSGSDQSRGGTGWTSRALTRIRSLNAEAAGARSPLNRTRQKRIRRCIPARRLKPLPGPPYICLDTYMLCGVYQESGICVRNHCGAEPPRDIEPPGLVTTVGWRDRASTSYAAADRVKAPASAARGRFRGIHGGRTAPSLPAET